MDTSFETDLPVLEPTEPIGEPGLAFDSLPDELLSHIVSLLNLETRTKLCQVCHRFHKILTSASSSLVSVAVLNLFQDVVWKNNVNHTAGSTKIKCTSLPSISILASVLQHISIVSSAKLWFRDAAFVEEILRIVSRDRILHMKCLDVYPYSTSVPLELIHEALPDLNAMTLRPHGEGFFWDGLGLPEFPAFTILDTLVLDSVNLGPDAVLPPSITQLEWSNRKVERFEDFLPKLAGLPNLQYLLLGHVDFARTDVLRDFFNVCAPLDSLNFLVFKFVKFPSESLTWLQLDFGDQPPLPVCKVLKIDLCYGDLNLTLKNFIAFSDQLKIVSLNYLYEDFTMPVFNEILPTLQNKKISVQFGLLQKNSGKLIRCPISELEMSCTLRPPILALKDVLWKLDMSFLEDAELLKLLLSCGAYWQLIEMKFVSCPAVDDEFLETAAKNCPRLRKVSISRCDKVTAAGINAFLVNWDARKSRCLNVMWRSKDHPAAYYLHLLKNTEVLTDKFRSRFITKTFPNDALGERIIVWDKKERHDDVGAILPAKTMVIQDYTDSDSHAILGFSVPVLSAVGTGSVNASDTAREGQTTVGNGTEEAVIGVLETELFDL